MNIAIIGVVPQPGATFPYSEFKGLRISPNLVLNAIVFFDFMEIATVLNIFILSLLLGITGYSIYTAFGPSSKDLRDPFEEHEE
mgnify:CR=1 FL=1